MAGELFPAWVPPRGEAWIALGFAGAFVKRHYSRAGDQFDAGHIRYDNAELQLGYSLADRLALSVGLPYRWTKYEGAYPDSVIDNGTYHGTFQDYHFELQYQVLKEPVALTPFVGFTIPSHDYVSFAHSAAGFDLHEYPIGFDFGRRLDPWLEGAFVQGRYTYTFVEEFVGLRHDRSTVNLEIGDYLRPSIGVRAFAIWQRTLGGLDLPDDLTQPSVWPHRIARENFLDLGGGLLYGLSGPVDLYVSYTATVSGTNSEKINQGLTFGLVWGFTPSRLFRSGHGP